MNERFLRDIETGVIHQAAFGQQPLNSHEAAVCGFSFRHRSWELTHEGSTCIGCIGYVEELVSFSSYEGIGVSVVNARALQRLELAEDAAAFELLEEASHQGFEDGFNQRLKK